MEWVPRDQNIEADALTNDDASAFDPTLEMEVTPGSLRFNVLNELLELGDKFYEERERGKELAKTRPPQEGAHTSARTAKKARLGMGARKATLKTKSPW